MENRIRDILEQSGLAQLPADPNASLTSYGLDSLALVLLVIRLEKEFGLKINPAAATLDNFSSIERIKSSLLQAGGT